MLEQKIKDIDFEKIFKIKDYFGKTDYKKDKDIEIKDICTKAYDEFIKLVDNIIDKDDPKFKKCRSGWNNGSKIYEHLWKQFRFKNSYTNYPFSISLFYANDKFFVTLEQKINLGEKDIDPTPEQLEHFEYLKTLENDFEKKGFKLDGTNNRICTKIITGPYINNSTQKIVNEIIECINILEPYYNYIFTGTMSDTEEQSEDNNNMGNNNTNTISPLNQILYGPPGTGKTYNTVVEAIKILDTELYNKYIIKKPTLEEYKNWYSKNPPSGKDEISKDYLNRAFTSLQKYEEELNNQKFSLFNITTEKELDDYLNKIKNSKTWHEYKEHNWIETIVNNYLNFYKYWKNETYKELQNRFNEFKNDGRIEFITFHQSYSYEEFVEGIKPEIEWKKEEKEKNKDSVDSNSYEIKYVGKDGIFKEICEKAENIISFDELFEKFKEKYPNESKLTWNEDERIIYYNENNGITDDTKAHSYIAYDKLKQLYNKNRNKILSKTSDINKIGKSCNGLPNLSLDVLNLLKELENELKEQEPCVLIIDEINRGNISKIFGELITLIEEDKRIGEKHEMRITLPYSQDSNFGVPSNLYIIGTMNTSDRSIASVDIALRRRFKFKEMMPESNCVENLPITLTIKNKEKSDTLNTNLQEIFKILNNRISALLDRDHQIGHSYFINVKDITDLKTVWFDSVMPLLNEYFYGDWDKLQLILGEAKGEKESSFIEKFVINNKNPLFAKCSGDVSYDIDKYYDFRDNNEFFKDNNNEKFLNALSYAFSDAIKDEKKDEPKDTPPAEITEGTDEQ